MKTLPVFLSFLLSICFMQSMKAQDTRVYSDNFSYPNGTTSATNPITGAVLWSTDISSTLISGGHFEAQDGRFEANETNGEGVWMSGVIDISCISDVAISVDLSESSSLENDDSIKVSYILDGGPETQFSVEGIQYNDFGSEEAEQTGLNGSTLQIVIRISNNDGEEHRFDNIVVEGTDICTNPDLNAQCPLTIIFVMDESGSIDGQGGGNTAIAPQVRAAATGLMEALVGTNSEVAVVEFNETAKIAGIISPGYQLVDQNYLAYFDYYITADNNTFEEDTKYDPEDCDGCSTNWEAALEQVYAINEAGPVAQLVLFFTDGEPTAYNNGWGVTTNSNNTALEEAAGAANLVTEQGSHIMVIGVPNPTLDVNNVTAISGTDIYDQNNLIVADYSIETSASLESALRQIATLVCRSDLWLTKTVTPNTACVGTDVTFTITVNNDGLQDATGVQIKDYLPAGYTYVSNNGGAADTNGIITWNLTDTLIAGQSATLEIVAIVNASGSYLNAAEVFTSDYVDPDSDPGNYVFGAILEDDEAETTVTVVNCDDNDPCTIDECNNGICSYTAVPISCNITGTQTICAGQSSTFTASGGDTYFWTGPAGFTPTSDNPITVGIPGTYNLVVSVAGGCTSSCSRVLTVNASPTCNISGNTLICDGENTTLTASGGTSYSWSNGSSSNAITVSPSTTTTYTVTVTDANNCSSTCNVQVQVTTTCDDNNACTVDACENGVCSHTPIVCDDNSACTIDACDPILGCVFTPINCDDGSVCTLDDCDSLLGCVYTPIAACCTDNGGCDDGNACTIDSCNGGECIYTAVICDDNNACTADACNPIQGCVFTPINCDDNDACTIDNCDIVNGCSYTSIVCDDGSACTIDDCDPVLGCVFTPINCDDNNDCTLDECDSLLGCINTPIVCDDGSACTTDDCDPVLGCVFTAITCSDGDLCTTDSCTDLGGCIFTPKNCDDGDLCTTDACNNGVCEHSPISYTVQVTDSFCSGTLYTLPDGSTRNRPGTYTVTIPSSNGCDSTITSVLKVIPIFCTISGINDLGCTGGSTSFTAAGGDSYLWNTGSTNPTINGISDPGVYSVTVTNSSGCVSNCFIELQSLSCSDSNACTIDVCVGLNTCSHTPIDCDDNNPCTTESCDPSVGCIYTPVPDCCQSVVDCDDLNPCTTDECTGNICVNTPIPDCCQTVADCDDLDPCTIDECNGNTCVNTPINCDDGLACTLDSCAGGTCINISIDCPVDCIVSDWSDFGPCTVTCGGGIEIRTRTITSAPEFGGAACPVLADTLACNTDPCLIDCAVSDWSDFGPCTVTCGGGIQIRNRTIDTIPQNGGAACPVLADTLACNTDPCPIDCVVSEWSDFGPCSVTCGGGIQIRNRTVDTIPQNGGAACPVLADTATCNTDPCPIDCVVSEWTPFGPCSDTCGGGIQIRTRTIDTIPEFGGGACPALIDTAICGTDPCPGDCIVSDWSDFGPCSVTCGGGIQIRTRTIITDSTSGGAACPVLTDTATCGTDPCPIDCVVSEWIDFGPCSVTCGGGIQIRTRTVDTIPEFGGASCPVLTDTLACNEDPCPIDCVVSDWSDFGPCSVTCGGGIQIRTRTIDTIPEFGGAACPVLTDTATCGTDPCPIDCVVGDWGDFGPCSVTCGGGIQIRTRAITTDSAFGGAACPVLTDTATCGSDPCPIDCVVGDWSDFGPCSVTCGGGIQTRTRTITTDSAFGGAACPILIDTIVCNTDTCPTPIDCVVSDWTDFGPCSVTCGGGVQTRSRTVETDSAFGGAACPVLTDTAACNTDPCPIDCVVSDWSDFGPCSVTCGGGIEIRTRTITTDSAFGGAACPVLADTATCNTDPCPIDCVVSDWSDFSPCSDTCGGGFQIRTRTIDTIPEFGGVACPALIDTAICGTDPCPGDCVVSDWSDFGPCSVTCGGGIQIRTRTIITDSTSGGAACPVLTDTATCGTDPCPIDCVVSGWSDFGPCSVTCGGGIQVRTRTIFTDSAFGGTACPILTDTVVCNTDTCPDPVDCVVSEWSDFGPCSITCGGGIEIRTRTIETDSAFGGAACPVLSDTATCNTDPCPIDCVVSDWVPAGPCSDTCGGGTQILTRTIVTDSAFGGAACPALIDTVVCNNNPCPVDCEVGEWGDFGPCSVTCGGGIQIRTRPIETDSAFGGAACPILADTAICNTNPCDPCLTLNCDDNDPCTVDDCEPFIGCTHESIPNCVGCGDEDCNDNNACTLDECVNDNCVNTPLDCDDGDACTIDGCNPYSGCFHIQKSCNDHNNCTIDICVDGNCIHTPE